MKKLFFTVLVFSIFISIAFSQDSPTNKELKKQQKSFLIPGKPWTIELPLWLPGFAGNFTYGDVTLEGEDGVDPEQPIEPPPGWEFGKIFSRLFTKNWYLKFFYLTKISYEKNGFLVQLDGIAGAVGNSVKFNYNDKQVVQANFRSVNLRLFGGYRIVNATARNEKFRYELYGYIGLRAYFQKIYSDLDGLANKLDINPVWVEPLIGIQNLFTWKRWFLVLQGDYGGLFNQSKSSVQVSGYVYYRTGRITSVKAGWNHIILNHYGRIKNEDYKVKATFSGPSIGITFHF